jgi:Tn3 transposase DDE domain
MKLYVPGRGDQYAYPALAPALTRPIRWDVIENNYDLMMKYATAIRLRTASTEALLRRFTSETTHPAYAAMLEVGRAQRSIFLARWLRDRDLQRETESGLNVVENYNGVNDYIRFGKRGELASNRHEEQELGMLCLHILQSSLGSTQSRVSGDTSLTDTPRPHGTGEKTMTATSARRTPSPGRPAAAHTRGPASPWPGADAPTQRLPYQDRTPKRPDIRAMVPTGIGGRGRGQVHLV